MKNVVPVHVVAVDIEKYSLRNSKCQHNIIKVFIEHLRCAKNNFEKRKENITFLSTGDGVAVVFKNEKQSNDISLKFSFDLLRKIKVHNKSVYCVSCKFELNGFCPKCAKYNIRLGIESGDVIQYDDINDKLNFAGKPLNNAFRIMGVSHRNSIAIAKGLLDSIRQFKNKSISGFSQDHKDEFVIVKHNEPISIYRQNSFRANKNSKRRLNNLFWRHLCATKLDALQIIPALSPPEKDTETIGNILSKHLGNDYQKIINEVKDDFIKDGRLNDPHAFCIKIDDGTWRYHAVDYATIIALRKYSSYKPKVIYSTVVVLCADKREIYLHRRGKTTNFASCWHVFGGGFMPKLNKFHQSDKESLLQTAMREVLEETGLSIQWNKRSTRIIQLETSYGIETVLLACNVTPDNVDHIKKETWEGSVFKISFNQLYNYLLNKRNRWCPTGMVSLLYWLAVGTPGCEPDTRFGNYNAQELFDIVIQELEKRYTDGRLKYDEKKGIYFKA